MTPTLIVRLALAGLFTPIRVALLLLSPFEAKSLISAAIDIIYQTHDRTNENVRKAIEKLKGLDDSMVS